MDEPFSTPIVIEWDSTFDEIDDNVLYHIALGTATTSGKDFFCALVEHTAKALNATTVFVTECTTPNLTRARTLAHWYKGHLAEDFEYDLALYPCRHVVQGKIYIQPSSLSQAYPDEDEGLESYIGVPLISTKGQVLGHLVVMNDLPVEGIPNGLPALRIFAARAALELERLLFETELVMSEERYRLLFDTNPLPILVFDIESYQVLAANRATTRAYGYDLRTLKTMRLRDLMVGTEEEDLQRWLDAPLEADQPWDCTFEHLTSTGQAVTVQISRRFLRFEGRAACLSLINDITERRHIERERDLAYQTLEQRVMERTREIEQRQRVAESLRDVLAAINSKSSVTAVLDFITQQATHLLKADAVVMCQYIPEEGQCVLQAHNGLQTHDLTGKREPPGWELIRQHAGQKEPIIISGGKAALNVTSGPRYDRQFQALLAVPLVIRDEGYGYVILYFLDPHDFSGDEVELATIFADHMALSIENSRLRQEAERMATFEERNRLARELHDAVTQTLWSASLLADVLPDLWLRDPALALKRLDQLRQLNRVALAEMRALLLELRPKALAEARLDNLLRQLVHTMSAQTNTLIDFDVTGELGQIPPNVQIACYRIAQEALNNVIRHAQAQHVTLQVVAGSGLESVVYMRIQDDGQGFDPAAVTTQSLGNKIMRERATAIGGVLTITSEPNAGTMVELRWSL